MLLQLPYLQIGPVGGGSHFVEMQVDVNDGSMWVMLHCGSRGYGWQTASHYFAGIMDPAGNKVELWEPMIRDEKNKR